MKPDFFWTNWEQPYKALYQVLLFVFLASMVFFAFTYISGSSFVINWEITNMVIPVKTLFDNYHLGLYTFPIFVDNFVIQQSFIASELQIHEWPAYMLLVWLGSFIIIGLSMITDLSRFWFLVCVILFTILLVGLKLDYLVLFDRYDKLGLGVAFVLYYPSLYIFHFVKKEVNLLKRIAVNFVATILFVIIIYKFSYVSLPFMHLANYGIYVPLILTIIFTFMIGHDIISGLLRLISGGALTSDGRSLYHFLIISLVYLANITLLLLKNTQVIDLDIYLIGAFFILVAAAVIGIWGHKTRETTYQGIFPFFPHGAFLYILLGITAFITLAYFYMSGNDFLVEVIEDAIVFSQLAYGLMFVVYFITNFYDIFRQNANVAKILYRPMRMPYFSSRLAGLIMILALFFKFNMTPYYQAVAGFYTGIGDLYLEAGDYDFARQYYDLSTVFSSTSHRANYAMATLEKRTGKVEEEISYLKQAVRKNPTEFAFANLASRFRDGENYFEALFTLQDGLKEFPDSGPLMNNLGLIYQDLDNIDSAFYQYNEASAYRKSKNQATANIYAFLRLKELSIKADTLNFLLQETESLSAINNLLVLANELHVQGKDQPKAGFGDPERGRIDQIVYNYNILLNDPMQADSLFLEEMSVFYDSGKTSWFEDNLNKVSALALYQQGKMSEAFERLNFLAIQNPEDEYYSMLGKLALALNAPGLAVNYFKSSFQEGHLDIAPELAFAYMENDELEKAAFIWKQILLGGDSSDIEIAQKMIHVIEANSIEDVLYADTETKFSFIAYRRREFDTEKLEALVLSFENGDAEALALLSLFDVYTELKQKEKAMEMLEKAGSLSVSLPHVIDKINLAQCQFAYSFEDKEVRDLLRLNLQSSDRSVRNFIELFDIMNLTDSIQAIERFRKMAKRNPFFEPGVQEAVDFLNTQDAYVDEAYSLLLNAVNLNPFSIQLNKSYALQCLRVGLKSYAMDAREELRQAMNSVAFRTFDVEFNNTMAEYDLKTSTW
jgi:lipopolysaccharide biosynthesis regulator YciM